jgi:hypothetical protein
VADAGPTPDDFAERIRTVGEATPGGETSSAGAQGQMQVLPTTAAAPGFGVKPVQLGVPGDLERVGRDYAKALLQKYSGNVALASAAYNAGPGRVDQWLGEFGDPRTGKISDAEWTAKLPYDETRGYVGRMTKAPALALPGPMPQAQLQSNSLTGGQGPAALAASPAPAASAASAASAAPAASATADPARALALLRLIVPASHELQPVDYDPWKIQKMGTGGAG